MAFASHVIKMPPAQMFSSLVTLDIVLSLAGLVFVWRLFHLRSRHPPLPPGPRGIPFIGNLLDMPSEKEWLTFAKWGEEYGMLIYHPTEYIPS